MQGFLQIVFSTAGILRNLKNFKFLQYLQYVVLGNKWQNLDISIHNVSLALQSVFGIHFS